MENNKLGLAGAALLIAGLFAPIFAVPLAGSINFIGGNSMLVTLSILALGCIGIFACARNEVANVVWAGSGALVILLSSLALAEYRFAQIEARFEEQIAGNPFAQAARDTFGSPQIEWGWLVLAIGAVLIVYASVSERKAAETGAFKLTDRGDKNYALVAGLACLVGISMVGIGHLNSEALSPNRSVANATGAMAENAAREVAAEAEANAAEQEKQKYISENMEVYDLEARYMDSWLDGRIPGVTFKVRNNGDRTLDSVEVTIEFLDAEGNPIAEEVYHPVIAGGYSSDPPLRPGYIWQNERGRFYSAKAVPSEWQSGRARAFVTDIDFAESE